LALTPYVESNDESVPVGIEHVAALAATVTVSPPLHVTADPREGVIAKVTVPVAPDVMLAVNDTP
jgi:hypothetical protein